MPIVNERVVQTMTFSSDPVYTVDLNQDMYFFKEMEKRTNVNFEFESCRRINGTSARISCLQPMNCPMC